MPLRIRKRLLPLIAVAAGVIVSGGVAFLAQEKGREVAAPSYVVVPLDEMSLTHEAFPWSCAAGPIGCSSGRDPHRSGHAGPASWVAHHPAISCR